MFIKAVALVAGVNLWVVILIILVSILAYFLNDPESWTTLKSELEKFYSSWR